MNNNTLTEKFKTLFVYHTDNTAIQLFRYVFVGGAAFIVDYFSLYFLKNIMHDLLAASFAFIFGLTTNYFLSKLFVFTQKKNSAFAEFLVFGLIGLAGLALTLGIIWLCTNIFGIDIMVSKIISTIMVFFWNFFARKYLLFIMK